MALPMVLNEDTAVMLQQSFAKSHAAGLQSQDIAIAGNVNIAEQTRLGYLEEKFKVGTREAAAMQRMDADKLAGQILQQRSARDQPDHKPEVIIVPKA